MERLPKVLRHEPIVDAVFEVRMGGEPQLADLLPGILYNHLEPKPSLQRLPAAEIPQPIRVNDPKLAFTPVIRLNLDQFTISLGSRNIVVGCRLPYPKWPKFKDFILYLIDQIKEVQLSNPVERYSIKYVNLIEAATISEQIQKINMSINVAGNEIKDDHINLQIHRTQDHLVHIISIATSAKARIAAKESAYGVVVDVDTIQHVQNADFVAFAVDIDKHVEEIRQKNKELFFSCLTNNALKEMEPEYD